MAGGWEFYVWEPDGVCTFIGGWWVCVLPDQHNCCECYRDNGPLYETACYEEGFSQFACEEILIKDGAIDWTSCTFHRNAACLDDDTCMSLEPGEACCINDGECWMLPPSECEAMGGTPQGAGTNCIWGTDACCLEDGSCRDVDPICCDDIGGAGQAPGTMCTGLEACCMPDNVCLDLDPLCCEELGGVPQGPVSGCVDMVVACCLPDGGCANVDPLCCDELDGVIMGDDCDSTDCLSIKWFQAPDLTPNGMDIALGWPQDPLRILADDFLCSQTGYVTDVHLWGSWKFDEVGEITRIELSFHSDDPVGPVGGDPDNLFSKPDVMLWQYEFSADEIVVGALC